MADGFDTVAERIAKKGAEVVGVIMRTQTGAAVVHAAIDEAGGMEGFDLGSRRRLETPMSLGIGIRFVGLIYGKVGMAIFGCVTALAIAEGLWTIVDFGCAECPHHGIVKWPCDVDVRDGDGCMIDQEHSQVSFRAKVALGRAGTGMRR